MTKQGDLKRAQAAMRTERLRIKEDRLLLERAQRKAESDRDTLRQQVADLTAQLAQANEEMVARVSLAQEEAARLKVALARAVADTARANEAAAVAVAGQRAAEHALATRQHTPAVPQAPQATRQHAPAAPEPRRDAPPARVATRQDAPRPLRPSVVPVQQHRCMVVDWQIGLDIGHRATCLCGWNSSPSLDEGQALRDGNHHEQRYAGMTWTPPQQYRGAL